MNIIIFLRNKNWNIKIILCNFYIILNVNINNIIYGFGNIFKQNVYLQLNERNKQQLQFDEL